MSERPEGWEWFHEHDAKLIARDGLMCEAHPGLPFEHPPDRGWPQCPGPGMAWRVEGREAVEALARGAP